MKIGVERGNDGFCFVKKGDSGRNVLSLRQKKTIGAMTQIERITEMERHLAVAQRALASMAVALDEYESSLSSLAALRDYYGSESWRQDFSADEAGRLPRGLNRGVLSEDGIWNVLEDWRSTEVRLSALAGSA